MIPADFEQGRLRYERMRPEHAGELEPVLLDPKVWVTLQGPDDRPPSADDVRQHVEAKCGLWERDGFGFWALRDRRTGVIVGRGGLQRTTIEGAAEVEAGWAIASARWGEGLATELALTSVEVAFGTLALSRLVSFTLPHNLASRRVMEKSGFRFEREITHANLPHVLYARGPSPTCAPDRTHVRLPRRSEASPA